MSSSPQPLGWRRLAGRASAVAVALVVLAAICETLGSVVLGRLAGGSTRTSLLWLLGMLLIGSAVLDTTARTLASRVVGEAERLLRADLLHAALHQPLPVLQEQAVGEVIDRVDDDVAQVGTMLRRVGWDLAGAALRSLLAWVVAGLTWWGAWIAFPLVAFVMLAVVRPLAHLVAQRKQSEEAAWSESAAQLEEAVAGRDDVRSSLGQAYVVRQYAERARVVLHRVSLTSTASGAVTVRAGLMLHALLGALALGGVWLVSGGHLRLAALVTVWVLATVFVGQLNNVTHRLPEAQAGLGAISRIRTLLKAEQEPVGGLAFAGEPATVEVRGLTFAYDGAFSLRDVSLLVPAGTTCALVGRSGAGKTTLASFLSRALEPPPGTVFVGGQDVRATALPALRYGVGVVTQRTEILAASLLENVTLFADVARADVVAAFDALDLTSWVACLPDGLDTDLGVGGVHLSAGEEQLVAFARLLVRDVRVVVLDEATARMDPETEQRVTQAARRLLAGRTGLLVAHRLATTERCDTVAVLSAGRIVQQGPRAALAAADGPFRDLLRAAGDGSAPESGVPGGPPRRAQRALTRTTQSREARQVEHPRPNLAATVCQLLCAYPRWGFLGACLFAMSSLFGAYGAVTGWLWGRSVASLAGGSTPWREAALLASGLVLAPLAVSNAIRVYPMWWSACTLRLRLAIVRGQTMQRRLPSTPPGEVTARALDSDRLIWYADRWVDVLISVFAVAVTALLGRSWLAVAVLGGVLGLSALTAAAGAPLAGRAAAQAGDDRALFGRSLASALNAARTVVLAGATATVQEHLHEVDRRRVRAHIREYRVRTLIGGVPGMLVQAGVVAAWIAYVGGAWPLATALLVSTAVSGFGWFGTVAASAATEAPVARRWLRAVAELAGTPDLMTLPEGVDLQTGVSASPPLTPKVALQQLTLHGVTAVHDDGTVGVSDVDLAVDRGTVVLLAGRVGSGKSSLLRTLAGLVDHEGDVRWNGHDVTDPQIFLRPGQVAYVGQVPRVLSGSFSENVSLDHRRPVHDALVAARLDIDVSDAGGHAALIGHRGVRLSGGQVQRLALARALATDAELLIADDISSALDARTEVELWEQLRRRGVTVLGTSSKRAALERADLVVVLEDGRVAAQGTWAELAQRWGHLAA